MPKKATADPNRIAAQIARGALDVREIYNEATDDEQFGVLVTALIEALPEHSRKHVLTVEQEVETYNQLADGLPEELKPRLFAFNEWRDLNLYVREKAGFLVGVEIGRRLGGVL